MRNLSDYLTDKQAAKLLGATAVTLRNWDRAGKFPPDRYPLDGYRLYRRDALEGLPKSVANDGTVDDQGRLSADSSLTDRAGPVAQDIA